MRNFKYFIILFSLVLVSSCNKVEVEEDNSYMLTDNYKLKEIKNEDYKVTEIDLASLNITNPKGLELVSDNFYITNSGQSSINVVDKNFEINDSISIDAIVSPSLMTLDSDSKDMYVLDESTRMVNVVDPLNKTIKKSYNLPAKNTESRYIDLESYGDSILLTSNTPISEDAKILRIENDNGEVKEIGENFLGFVSIYEDESFLINSLEYFINSTESGFKPGLPHMYKLEEDKIKEIGSMIDGSIPGDFLIDDDYYYVYTVARSSIDRYDHSLKYVDTIANFEYADIEAIIKGDSSQIYLLMPNEGKLWEISKKWN